MKHHGQHKGLAHAKEAFLHCILLYEPLLKRSIKAYYNIAALTTVKTNVSLG